MSYSKPSLLQHLLFRTLHGIILVVFLFGWLCPANTEQTALALQDSTPQERALALLQTLQPQEKVGQLMLVTFPGMDASSTSQIYDLIVNHHVCGVVLLDENDNFTGPDETVKAAWSLIRQLQTDEWDGSKIDVVNALGIKQYTPAYIPLFIGLTQEGDGPPNSQIFNGLTPLPNQMAIGATWQPDLATEVGTVLGTELYLLGINMLFGPSMDILENPNPEGSGDMGTRTFGGDPFWVGEMSKAYIAGVHKGSQGRVAVVGKYFPGRGGSDRSPEEEVATIRKSLDQLNQIELAPFFAVTGNAPNRESTVDALLTSHIRYQGFQGNIRTTTRPISFDPQAFAQLIGLPPLTAWHENGGVMVSNDLGSKAVRRFYDPTGETFNGRLVARDAFLAGNDLLYLGNFVSSGDQDAYSTIVQTLNFFEQKYREDPAFAKRVDESVLRILTLKYTLYPNFSPIAVFASQENLSQVGTFAQITFNVAREAATLIDPSPAELDSLLPTPPQGDDRIVFITNTSQAHQCSTCPDQDILAADALQQVVTRLYGQSPGGQINHHNLISFSSSKLSEMLDVDRGTSDLEFYLRQAQWIVFALLEVHTTQPDTIALRRFLTERPDLLRGKQIIVFALNAPYYLDATDVSKITAYYGLYSKTPQFVEVAARLLFNELRPVPGSLPVSAAGVGYDLISIISPDPNQVIPLMLDFPEAEGTTTPVITPEATAQASFKVGDLVPVRTGVVQDYNGHPVPDNTPVHFILSSTGEGATLLEEAVTTTTGGIARTTFSLKSPGALAITAKSESASQSSVIRIDVAGEALPTAQPSPEQTEVADVALTPTLMPLTPASKPEAGTEKSQLNLLDWVLAICIGSLFSWLVFRAELLKGEIRSGMRNGLSTLIGGLIIYTYVALRLPGGNWLMDNTGHVAGILAVIAGSILGWIASRARSIIREQSQAR